MTVFIVQEPTKWNPATQQRECYIDLKPAAEYGEIDFLLPPGNVMLSPQPMVATMRRKLRNFCDKDYLLPIGDPAAMVTASAIAAAFNRGVFRLLKWDRNSRRYISIQVNTSGYEV